MQPPYTGVRRVAYCDSETPSPQGSKNNRSLYYGLI